MGGFEFGASESLMNPLTLFLQADIVVKLVMIGLLLAILGTLVGILTVALAVWLHRLVAVGDDPYPYSSLRAPSLMFEGVQFSGT